MVDVNHTLSYSKITSVNITNEIFTLKVFPNPAKNILFITTKADKGPATLQIFDINGMKIKELKTNLNGSVILDISKLPIGQYSLQILMKTSIQNMKFLKK